MELERQSYEEYKSEQFKGIVFLRCHNCKTLERIHAHKIKQTWRGICLCGKALIADYKIINADVITWKEYEYLKKIKEITRAYRRGGDSQ